MLWLGILGWVWAAAGWALAFGLSRQHAQMPQSRSEETRLRRVALLREQALKLEERGIECIKYGEIIRGQQTRDEAARLIAEADRLDPPPVIDPGAEPGRLSLVKIKGE